MVLDDHIPVSPRLELYGHDDPDPGLRSGTDDRLNLQTHAAGFVASLVASITLCYLALQLGDFWLQLSCAVYGLTMMSVYGASALSHGRYSPKVRHFYRTLDQVSIFLFIAASTSPYLVSFCRDRWGALLLGMTWLLALVGVGLKLFVTRLGLVPVWYYLVVGWFPGLSLIRIGPEIGWTGVALLLASAAAFTGGTWFLTNDHRAPWYHAVWHVLVIVGTGLQYTTVLLFVLPWAE
jgi:hemolysin III